MTLHPSDWWMLATACAAGVSCAAPGVYLVLRKLSLLGDAISHAILPGIAMAFILSGSRNVLPMLAGALAAGLLTAGLSAWISRRAKVPEDSAFGVVFTSLFALGVLMISLGPRSIDLDPGCVLYGEIERVPLDMVSALGIRMPRALVALGSVMVVNLTLAVLFHKELKATSFDPYLATTMGLSAAWVHYGLMGVVAVTSVVCFEAVGSVLVVAMLIAPGATAYLLTDRLGRMMVLAGVVAVIAAVAGYFAAVRWNTNVAGSISVCLGLQFALAALGAPRHGVLAKFIRHTALALRVRREDILGRLYRAGEGRPDADAPPTSGLAGLLAVSHLRARGLIAGTSPALTLTTTGLRTARHLIASHRLWETFLNERLGLPPDHVHDPSERMEHFITPQLADELREDLNARRDPQGREIPD